MEQKDRIEMLNRPNGNDVVILSIVIWASQDSSLLASYPLDGEPAMLLRTRGQDRRTMYIFVALCCLIDNSPSNHVMVFTIYMRIATRSNIKGSEPVK